MIIKLEKSLHSNTWSNNDEYLNSAKPNFFLEITEFVGDRAKKGVYRAWIIETPNGKFTNEKKNKHYCNGYNDNFNIIEARVKMEQMLKKFSGIDVQIELENLIQV